MALMKSNAAWRRALYRITLPRWQRAAQRAKDAKLEALRTERAEARKIKSQLDRLIHIADERLALPMVGSHAFDKPFVHSNRH